MQATKQHKKSQSGSVFNAKRTSNLADTGIITLRDYERIQITTKVPNKADELNTKVVSDMQIEGKQAKGKSLKERMLDIDKQKSQNQVLSDLDKENLEINRQLRRKAEEQIENGLDEVKDLKKLVLYSQVAGIRERQLDLNKRARDDGVQYEKKMDMLMELRRLEELKQQEEIDLKKKEQRKLGALVIVDQMQDRKRQREYQKELVEIDRQDMLQKMRKLEEDEKRLLEEKKITSDKLSREVEEFNRRAEGNRERRRIEEKELDIRMLHYQMEKARKEEEDIAEKKRLQDEKERETQKLREKQEKAKDKQSIMDAIRAKRAFEESERVAREKEKFELIHKHKQLEELLQANAKQKIEKEMKLAELAKQEQDEYMKIVDGQVKSLENERQKEENKKTLRYEHNSELRRQIKEREERDKQFRREDLEDGRKLQQKQIKLKSRLEEFKAEKIQDLRNIGVKEKYIADIVKYKINNY